MGKNHDLTLADFCGHG